VRDAAAVIWFRRDLRLSDHPALLAAVDAAGPGGQVVAAFCLDDRLRGPSGPNRLAFLYGCLRDLDEAIGGNLTVRAGDPVRVIPDLAREVGAEQVFVSADFGPYGAARDVDVEDALASRQVDLVRVGSPYAVDPGTIRNKSGAPYKVFTPFSGAWRAAGWTAPQPAPRDPPWMGGLDRVAVPGPPATGAHLPAPGEHAAKLAARRFWDSRLESYADRRNDPGADATSRLSPYLKWGCLHPRQLLAKLGRSTSDAVFRTELCWREFYADVLHHRPDTVRQAFSERMRAMPVDSGSATDRRFRAWAEGRTGYPIVDAGMRQLATEGWVHNRVRMIVASFLVKDLHLDWTRGARHFMAHLVDGDLASNTHGWQWVAGTGTDAAPYFRVFNPVGQGERFDPDGTYVRRWVPELADVDRRHVHRPWDAPDGPPAGYPAPIVDHAEEREESLRRYDSIR
jgi:deoxyribodipyrimidine photo-lyase